MLFTLYQIVEIFYCYLLLFTDIYIFVFYEFIENKQIKEITCIFYLLIVIDKTYC